MSSSLVKARLAQQKEKVKLQEEQEANAAKFCEFCRGAGLPKSEYTSHNLKDAKGFTCPRLLKRRERLASGSGTLWRARLQEQENTLRAQSERTIALQRAANARNAHSTTDDDSDSSHDPISPTSSQGDQNQPQILHGASSSKHDSSENPVSSKPESRRRGLMGRISSMFSRKAVQTTSTASSDAASLPSIATSSRSGSVISSSNVQSRLSGSLLKGENGVHSTSSSMNSTPRNVYDPEDIGTKVFSYKARRIPKRSTLKQLGQGESNVSDVASLHTTFYDDARKKVVSGQAAGIPDPDLGMEASAEESPRTADPISELMTMMQAGKELELGELRRKRKKQQRLSSLHRKLLITRMEAQQAAQKSAEPQDTDKGIDSSSSEDEQEGKNIKKGTIESSEATSRKSPSPSLASVSITGAGVEFASVASPVMKSVLRRNLENSVGLSGALSISNSSRANDSIPEISLPSSALQVPAVTEAESETEGQISISQIGVLGMHSPSRPQQEADAGLEHRSSRMNSIVIESSSSDDEGNTFPHPISESEPTSDAGLTRNDSQDHDSEALDNSSANQLDDGSTSKGSSLQKSQSSSGATDEETAGGDSARPSSTHVSGDERVGGSSNDVSSEDLKPAGKTKSLVKSFVRSLKRAVSRSRTSDSKPEVLELQNETQSGEKDTGEGMGASNSDIEAQPDTQTSAPLTSEEIWRRELEQKYPVDDPTLEDWERESLIAIRQDKERWLHAAKLMLWMRNQTQGWAFAKLHLNHQKTIRESNLVVIRYTELRRVQVFIQWRRATERSKASIVIAKFAESKLGQKVLGTALFGWKEVYEKSRSTQLGTLGEARYKTGYNRRREVWQQRLATDADSAQESSRSYRLQQLRRKSALPKRLAFLEQH